MSDLSTRLLAALDEAERKARAATPGPWAKPYDGADDGWLIHNARGTEYVLTVSVVYSGRAEPDAEHIASWDPNTVLRLIARDRALLTAYERADRYVAEHVEQCGENLCSCREYVTWTATASALRMVLGAAAEFWLGDTG